MGEPRFSSEELSRAIQIARHDALIEAAAIAREDHTPGYGVVSEKVADTIEWLAEAQRRNIADRIAFAALRDFPNTNVSAPAQQANEHGEKKQS